MAGYATIKNEVAFQLRCRPQFHSETRSRFWAWIGTKMSWNETCYWKTIFVGLIELTVFQAMIFPRSRRCQDLEDKTHCVKMQRRSVFMVQEERCLFTEKSGPTWPMCWSRPCPSMDIPWVSENKRLEKGIIWLNTLVDVFARQHLDLAWSSLS